MFMFILGIGLEKHKKKFNYFLERGGGLENVKKKVFSGQS